MNVLCKTETQTESCKCNPSPDPDPNPEATPKPKPKPNSGSASASNPPYSLHPVQYDDHPLRADQSWCPPDRTEAPGTEEASALTLLLTLTLTNPAPNPAPNPDRMQQSCRVRVPLHDSFLKTSM